MVGLIGFMMILSSATFALGFYLGRKTKQPEFPTLSDSIIPLQEEELKTLIRKGRFNADENALKRDRQRMREEEKRRPS